MAMGRDLSAGWVIAHSDRHFTEPEPIALDKAEAAAVRAAGVGHLRRPYYQSIVAHSNIPSRLRTRATECPLWRDIASSRLSVSRLPTVIAGAAR
jgi:hypothetical protein